MVTVMGRRSRSRDRQSDYDHRAGQFYNQPRTAGGQRGYTNYRDQRYGSHSPEEYLNLRFSNIPQSFSDRELRQILEKEFNVYGEMHTKVISNPDAPGGRIAYVNFDQYGDARIARHECRPRIHELLGSKVRIDPAGIVRDSSRSWNSNSNQNHATHNRSPAPVRSRTSRGEMSPSNARRDGDRYYADMGRAGVNRSRDHRSRSPLGSPLHGRILPRQSPLPPAGDYSRRGRSRSPLENVPSGYSGHHRYSNDRDRSYNRTSSNVNLADRRAGFASPPSSGARQNPRHDEENATRTLFVGNLDYRTTREDLLKLFASYGFIEDVDIKRGPGEQAHPFAFILFQNMDMARRAKANEVGRMLLGQKLSVGYGKPKQSRRLWVGGLGRGGISLETLEREFDRFGAIEKIDFLRGENHAYILFELLDAAMDAFQKMKGAIVNDRKLLVDYASDDITIKDKREKTADRDSNRSASPVRRSRDRKYSGGSSNTRSSMEPTESSGRRNQKLSGSSAVRAENGAEDHSSSSKKARTKPHSTLDADPSTPIASLARQVKSISEDLTGPMPLLPQVWQGAFVLKRSAYPILLFHLKGSLSLVNRYIRAKNGTSCPLVVSQRLKLDQPKREDIPKWIQSPDYCFLVAIPWNNPESSDIQAMASGMAKESGGSSNGQNAVQTRSVKMLVKYFKEKEAAGVVNLTSSRSHGPPGMLYAFPECSFATALLDTLTSRVELLRTCTDEVLLLVLIRGTA